MTRARFPVGTDEAEGPRIRASGARLAVLVLLIFSLNWIWEMGQAVWFSSMWGLGFWRATWLCTRASMADVVITIALYGAVALVLRNRYWIAGSRAVAGSILYLVLAWSVTWLIEQWAMSTGRWSYAPSMPMVAGAGLLPLLQWTLVPILVLFLARRLLVIRRIAATVRDHEQASARDS